MPTRCCDRWKDANMTSKQMIKCQQDVQIVNKMTTWPWEDENMPTRCWNNRHDDNLTLRQMTRYQQDVKTEDNLTRLWNRGEEDNKTMKYMTRSKQDVETNEIIESQTGRWNKRKDTNGWLDARQRQIYRCKNSKSRWQEANKMLKQMTRHQ